MSVRQHAGLSAERWTQFGFAQQLLMIANELHRARKLGENADLERRQRSLERVYALTDLTIAANEQRSRRRELLRWREQLGLLYLEADPRGETGHALLRALLQLSPEAAGQIPFVAA